MVLLDSLCDAWEDHVLETILLAAGELGVLAAHSTDSQSIENAATIFRELACYIKRGKFGAQDAHIKVIRTARTLACELLRNGHARDGLREQVASLGIPNTEVSTEDVALLWWLLQFNPKALGVNAQTVDNALSKRLIRNCGSFGLFEQLSQICLGSTAVIGDGMAQCHSLALLVHFARMSEDMMERFNRCMHSFEDVATWSTVYLFNALDESALHSHFDMTADLQACSGGPQTIIWMALCVWLPHASEGVPAWLPKKAFGVIVATLLKLHRVLDTMPYASYLMRWYIKTGGELISAGVFFSSACRLPFLSQSMPPSKDQFLGYALFLQAATVALDRVKLAHHSPPPECMLETAMDCARCLMCVSCQGSGRIIARFFSSALHYRNGTALYGETSGSGTCSTFISSRMLLDLRHALGDKCTDKLEKSLKSGVPRSHTCRTIEESLLQGASSHGGA